MSLDQQEAEALFQRKRPARPDGNDSDSYAGEDAAKVIDVNADEELGGEGPRNEGAATPAEACATAAPSRGVLLLGASVPPSEGCVITVQASSVCFFFHFLTLSLMDSSSGWEWMLVPETSDSRCGVTLV